MANPKGNPATLGPAWKKGEAPNPGGKPVGARNRLQGNFVNALADDFELHGKKAIVELREKDVATYVRVVAGLMPKELEIKRPVEELTDDELAAAIAELQAIGTVKPAGRPDPAPGRKQAKDVPTLQ